jgi:hypothetical protein
MVVGLYFIESQKEMEVPLYVPAGSNDPNRLFIYTGIAVFDFKGTGQTWHGDTLSFEIGRVFSPGQVRNVVVTASLNSISNMSTAVDAGWAVDRINAFYNRNEGRIMVEAALVVRDIDGYVHRMGYQVTVLARV